MTAERNKCRSEAAAAGRAADKLKTQLDAMPKVIWGLGFPGGPICPIQFSALAV
jgi:hypothetical protein